MADDAEATVYRLPSTGDGGDQYFVELKTYSKLREKHDRHAESVKSLSQTVKELHESESKLKKSMSEKITELEEKNKTLEKNVNDIKLSSDEKLKELNETLKQAKEASESCEGDKSKVNDLKNKVIELEKYIEQLLELNTSIRHANAELTSNQNLSQSMADKIKLLEETNTKLEQSNNDLIIAGTKKQEELKQIIQDTVNDANNKIQAFQSKLHDQQQFNQQLVDINNSVKQANADLTNESREKLEIALEEVKKANAAEKALRIQNHHLAAEVESHRAIAGTLNKEITDLRNVNAANEEKITKLSEESQKVVEESDETKILKDKHHELYRAYQGRLAEISQLKIVNDRIERENKKWADEIKKLQNSTNRNGTEQESTINYFSKIKEAFIISNNIDEGSKQALPDEDICDLVTDLLKVHKGMKHHYEQELKKSIDRAKELTKQVKEKEMVAATYETSSGNKEGSIEALSKQLTIATQKIKSSEGEIEELKQQLHDKESDLIEKVKSQFAQETQKAIKLAQKENEDLMGKYITSQKEIAQLQKDLVTAVEKIKTLKGLN